jgi:tetratricopeptide (TPR) repeat protein
MTIEVPKARARRQRPAAPTTPDPVEIAMEIAASGKTPADAAMAVLHADAALLRYQSVLVRNQIFRNRVIMAVVLALIVAVGAVVWSASRTTGLVIQPFSVPPELVEDGLDGRAAAALFQDELIRLEAATDSARPAASFRNDWSGAISVEVEAGGLSLTDAYTALTRWLGQETFISGGLRRTRDGLELVVRSSDGKAVAVQGPADQPEALMQQAAERVYEQTQPYRYASYLSGIGDGLPAGPERQALSDRSRAIFTTLLDGPSEIERIWAYTGLSNVDGTSLQVAISLLEAALKIDPEHPNTLYGLANRSAWLGQTEAERLFAQRAVTTASNPRNRAKVNRVRQQVRFRDNQVRVAALQGDYFRAVDLQDGLFAQFSGLASEIGLHQPSALLRLIEAEALTAPGRPGPGNQYFSERAAAAAELDQWPQALAFLETAEAERDPTPALYQRERKSNLLWPRLAYARARTGDLAGAQTLIAATPLDCYPCVRERARIAELAGDRPSADRWSAEARRQGPSLPFAFAERGQMLMARGDVAGAIAFYEQAIERGPRYADPQKYWGDALMARGDEAGAIRKYRAAADRAPQWGALHLAWGRALEAQGRRDQAREKYTEAARMDLSAADRAEVGRRLGAA